LDEHLLGPGLEEKVIIDKPQPVDQAWDEEALNLSDTEGLRLSNRKVSRQKLLKYLKLC